MATATVKGSTMKIAFEENGIRKEREATAEEIAYLEAAQAEAAEAKAAELAEVAAQAEAKAEILDRLGITAEEAALLLA